MVPMTTQRTLPTLPTTSCLREWKSGVILHLVYKCEIGSGAIRERVHPDGDEARDVGVRLGNSHSGFETTDALQSETGQGLLVAIEGEWREDVEVVVDDAETARHDTDDGARLCIDDEGGAYDGTVAAETALPVSITEDDVPGAVRDLIGGRELSASEGGTPRVCRTPSVMRMAFTCSGRANPVTLAFWAIHVPSD